MREFFFRIVLIFTPICIYIMHVSNGNWHDSRIGALMVPMFLAPPAFILTAVALYPLERWIRNQSVVASYLSTPFISAVLAVIPFIFLDSNYHQIIEAAKFFSPIGLGWGVLWAATGIIYYGASRLIGIRPAGNQAN